MPSRTERPAEGKAGARRTARVLRVRWAARISAAKGPRAAESTFLKKSALGSEPRAAAACDTALAAYPGESERELVLKACTDSGAENWTLVPNQTRTEWPAFRKAAAASHAPVRSSARTTMRPERESAKEG